MEACKLYVARVQGEEGKNPNQDACSARLLWLLSLFLSQAGGGCPVPDIMVLPHLSCSAIQMQWQEVHAKGNERLFSQKFVLTMLKSFPPFCQAIFLSHYRIVEYYKCGRTSFPGT
jgi:hypothetical protein